MTSYNLAPYNSFEAKDEEGNPAPENDTSLCRWSPMDFYVGHFARKYGTLGNDYLNGGELAMASIQGEMHLVHKGAWADQTIVYTEVFGLTGVFTAKSQLTNGFGTLAQAGWTLEEQLEGVALDATSPIAMASNGRRLLLVWRPSSGDGLQYRIGQYR